MATEDIELPGLRIPVTADLAPLGRQGPEAARQTEAISRAVREKFRQDLGAGAGRRVARDFTDAMERQFRVARADITEALARGLISREEAARRGHQAGEEYQQALLAEIRRRSLAGTLSDRDFVDLTDRLRSVGTRAGREFSTGAQGQLTGLSGWIRGAFAAGISVAVLGAFRSIVRGLEQIAAKARETIRLGGEAQQIGASFGNLATGQGLNPVETLESLQRGSRGLVSNLELMRRANAAFRVELPLTAESMGELVEISRRLAKVTGGDATDAFRRLVEGIGKGEPELLDELGIVTRLKDALQAWEKQTGRNSDSLDANAKKLIYFNAVMKEARAKVAGMGPEILTADERLTQLGVAWDNLKNSTAEAITDSPRVSAFLTSLGEDAAASAGKVQDLADHVGALFDTLAQLATSDAAKAIGGWMGRALGRQAGVARAAASPFLSGLGVDLDRLGDLNAENLARRRAQHAREDEINAEKNSAALLLRKVQTLQQIEALTKAGAEQNRATIESLRREVALIDQRRALMKQAKDDADPATDSASEAATAAAVRKIDNARTALEARIRAFQALAPLREMDAAPVAIPEGVPAQLQRIYAIDEEIRAIEGEIAQARGQAPAGIARVVDALQEEKAAIQANVTAVRDQFENLPQVQAQVAQVVRTLGEMQSRVIQDSAGGWHSVAEGMRAVKRAAQEAAEAQASLVAAQLSGDPERIAAAKRRQAEAEDRAREAARRALDIFERGTGKGKTAQAELNALIAEMTQLLRDAGVEAEKEENHWEGLAQQVEGVARGVLSVADALGVLDDQSRRALQGLIDVADAAARIAVNPADVGAWIQGVGGLVGVLQGLFGKSPEAQAALQRHRDAMVDLTRALLELKDAYLGNVSTEQLSTDFSFVGSLAATLSDDLRQGFQQLGKRNFIDTLAQQMGLVDANASPEVARAALESRFAELEQRFGVDLGSFLETGDFRGLLKALQGLGPLITAQIEKLGAFGDSVDAILERVNFQFQVLGNTDASERLAAVNAALVAAGKTAGDFQDEFNELSRLNLDTEAGRARRDEIVRAMSETLSAGGAHTGALSVDQLRDLILQWAQATGEAVAEAPAPPEPTGDLVADTLARVRFELDALGKTDAVERIRAVIQALRTAGVSFGEFGDELRALDRLDLSTPEGQQRQAEIIAAIVARMGAANANFGALTPEALRDLVLEYARAQGETAAGEPGRTESAGVSRGVTEVTMRREVSLLTTIAYWEEQSGRALQALLERQYPGGLPRVSAPSPAALGLTTVNGPVTYAYQGGPITLQVTSGSPVDEATVRGWATTLSDAQKREIDRWLGEQTARQQRAAGQNTARGR